MPAPPAVGPGGSGDADVLVDVRKRHAGGQQQLADRRLWGGWCGRSRRYRASLSLQLARITLCLCDPHLYKLKGVTYGPVSQTRVCEPTYQGHSSTCTASDLTRSWFADHPAQVSFCGWLANATVAAGPLGELAQQAHQAGPGREPDRTARRALGDAGRLRCGPRRREASPASARKQVGLFCINKLMTLAAGIVRSRPEKSLCHQLNP